MPYFVGLDVAKRSTSICVLDELGAIVEERSVETSPKAIIGALRGGRRRYRRLGMEGGPLSAWLYEGLAKAGLPITNIDARHAHAVLSTRRNKTDRNDARGIAELMRAGTYRISHIRSRESRELRSLLVAREAIVTKRADIDSVIMAVLLGFGLKLAAGARKTFAARAEVLGRTDAGAWAVIEPLLRVRAALVEECRHFDARVEELAKEDTVCRRLMTAPGIGPLAALAFKSAIEFPERFPASRTVGAHFGLTPRTHQSGERDVRRGITHAGDRMVRRLLYLAARSLSRRGARSSWLSMWARSLLERIRYNKAMVAVARKLAVVLHRMWMTETDFRWERAG